MSENFESTYESTFKNVHYLGTELGSETYTGSNLKGGDDGLYFSGINHWDDDYNATLNVASYTYKSNNSPDTISFNTSLFGNDHLTLNPPSPTFTIKMPEDTNKNGFWKYNEDKTLKEVEQYLSSTYHQHYTSQESKTQTLDLIESIGDAEPFTRSNAIKYLSRFGKKNGKSKMDILKAIHYCILLYHFAGLHKNTTSDFPY
jgi:hypothetical protein